MKTLLEIIILHQLVTPSAAYVFTHGLAPSILTLRIEGATFTDNTSYAKPSRQHNHHPIRQHHRTEEAMKSQLQMHAFGASHV